MGSSRSSTTIQSLAADPSTATLPVTCTGVAGVPVPMDVTVTWEHGLLSILL